MRPICLLLIGGLSLLGVWSLLEHSLHAFPEPATVPTAWQFDFEYRIPRAINFQTPDGRTRWYWYLTYTVTNNTDRERLFIPDITVATDEGDITPTGRGVPPGVFEVIKERLDNHLLESPIKVVGKLLRGPDHARDSVAIWPAPEKDVDLMSILVAGLSGETTVVKNPITQDPVLLIRTLMIDISVPGNPPSPQDQSVLERDKTWVMR